MNKIIKDYSFAEFANQNWYNWKLQSLTKAWEKVNQKLIESNASSYAYAGNVSKMPVLWDSDDWKFLSQFPPNFWTKALMWRYNQGLSLASSIRENDPNKSLDNVSDHGNVEFENHGKKYVFDNVYTGLKGLMEKLEKPIKYHSKHTPPGATENDPGLMDIDPHEQDPNHEKHRSKYKYGLHNYDITAPTQVSDDYIDSLPDEELRMPVIKGVQQERTPENIKAARDRLKKRKSMDFAGMSALNSMEVASKHMNNWLKAQGLGLLGNTPEKIKDPHTGHDLNVTQDVNPEDIRKALPAHVGDDTDGGSKIPLKVPVVTRNLSYKVIDKNGSEEQVNKPYKMPVLNPGRLLPRIVDLSSSQREKIAKRSGFVPENSCQGITGLDWAAIEQKCPAAFQAGQMLDVNNLMKNFDILTPEQVNHLKTNFRDLYHLATAHYGSNVDKWSQPKEHYAIGYSPNHARKGIEPSDMSKDDMKVVLDKYLPQLTQEADRSIGYFLKWAGSDRSTVDEEGNSVESRSSGKRYPPEVINMMETIHTDLAQVCGALLALNLQHPHLGIRDPEVKLTNVPEGTDEKENKMNRSTYAFRFCQELAQVAFGDLPSRRQRQKQGHGAVSLDAGHGTGDTETSLGANVASGDQASNKGQGRSWDTRRTELNPQTATEYDPVTGKTVYNIARLGWNVPKMDHSIDLFFGTKRNQIMARAGGGYASLADQARDRMKAAVETTRSLYEKYAQEMMAQGVPQDQIEAKAQEEVQKNLQNELVSKYPKLFQSISKEQVKKILDDQKSQLSGQVLTPELKAELDKAWENFFTDIITRKKSFVPRLHYDEEDKEYLIDVMRDAEDKPVSVPLATFIGSNTKSIVDFLKNYGEHIAQKYAVSFIRGIREEEGNPMSLEEAISEVKAAGVEPTEAYTTARTEEPQAPPVPKKPQQQVAPTPVAQTPMQTQTPQLAQLPVDKAKDLEFVNQHKSAIEALVAKLGEENRKELSKFKLDHPNQNTPEALQNKMKLEFAYKISLNKLKSNLGRTA